MVVQLPLVMSLGLKFNFNFDFKNKDVREMFLLMWPRSITLGLTRLSEIINIALASIAAIGSIAAFNFAQVLQLVPIAFFASPISQAALPSLSIQHHSGKSEQFKKLFLESFHQILFLILPSAAILAILRIPAVRLVFGARELPWEITVLTGRILIAFSIGISAQAISLLILLYRKVGGFDFKSFFTPPIKMGIITAITAISLYIPMKLLDQLVFDTTRTVGLILLTTIATLSGLTVYIILSYLFKIDQLIIFTHFLKRVMTWPSKLKRPPITSIDAQDQTP